MVLRENITWIFPLLLDLWQGFGSPVSFSSQGEHSYGDFGRYLHLKFVYSVSGLNIYRVELRTFLAQQRAQAAWIVLSFQGEIATVWLLRFAFRTCLPCRLVTCLDHLNRLLREND